jgi:hypothetical protein
VVHAPQASGSDGGWKRNSAADAEAGCTHGQRLLLQNADVGFANIHELPVWIINI